MNNILITLSEVADALGYEGRTAKRNAGAWLAKHKIENFGHRRGVYLRDSFWGAFYKEQDKCLQQERLASIITSEAQSASVRYHTKSPSDLLALLNGKMQESIAAN